jgi:hypothetical protein
MEALGNVIVLRTARKVPYSTFTEAERAPVEKLVGVAADNLLVKAKKVLDEMEAAWEMEHGLVELRDKFHLLRYYLERLSS